MAGISSKALSFGEPENKDEKFQGQPLDNDLGLNWYGFKWRNHDFQIGRFIQIDPLSEKYVYNSTYAFSENKVIANVELEGLESVPTTGTRNGATGRYPIQGDYNGDMVVDKSERNSWSAAVLSWLNIGARTYLMGQAPSVGFPLVVSEMSGVPVTPSPHAMSGAVASELSTVAAASDDAASLATKARVFEAGGEVGIMEGAASLAVDAKTGFFNVQVTAGAETGIITGEINVSKGAIGFTNLEITNAKGGLGSISQQNTIGPETFLKLQTEITELTKAGGYNKATVEFSRLRPVGSKLPDTGTRKITLFENTQQ